MYNNNNNNNNNINNSSSSVFCPRAGPSLQNAGTKAAILPKGRSSTANSGTKVAVLLGMNRYGSFPLLSAPHSPFSILTNFKRSKKIPGAPTRRWGEWIWLTGPSGHHRNSPQGLNISSIRVFDQIRDPEIPITLRPLGHQNHKKSFITVQWPLLLTRPKTSYLMYYTTLFLIVHLNSLLKGITGNLLNFYDKESSKYYARPQTAVARGLLVGNRAIILTLLPNTHSVISVHFPSRWSRASTYICKTKTLAFTDCDYCYKLVL